MNPSEMELEPARGRVFTALITKKLPTMTAISVQMENTSVAAETGTAFVSGADGGEDVVPLAAGDVVVVWDAVVVGGETVVVVLGLRAVVFRFPVVCAGTGAADVTTGAIVVEASAAAAAATSRLHCCARLQIPAGTVASTFSGGSCP